MNTTRPLPATTDVLVVGAGPTGLALTTVLAQANVDCVLVDRLEAGQSTSRAAVVHAHTLDVLQSLGVAEALLTDGLRLAHFSVRDRDRVLVRIDFAGLPSPHAGLLMLPQERTEQRLAEALTRAGGTVHRGCSVESLCPTSTGVRATLATAGGKRELHARYVVGADGMHSLVRQTAGIGFTGTSYEQSFVLADVDMQWAHGRNEVMQFFSPAGLVVVAPLPGNRFRIVATFDDAPPTPTVADMQSLLDARGPRRGATVVSRVHWGSRFRIHHRVADRYRQGPLLLVGDAAHVHSPAGGQGMNTGLVDACVLGQLLAEVVTGKAGDERLDLYERLRRPAAVQVLALAHRFTALATVRAAPKRWLRNLALRLLHLVPPLRRRLALAFSGLARRAAATVPPLV